MGEGESSVHAREKRLKEGLKKWEMGDRLFLVEELLPPHRTRLLLITLLLHGMEYSHQQAVSPVLQGVVPLVAP